jgi:hypothetical protein
MFSDISCGDLIRFSGCYVIVTAENLRVMMDTVHRDGVVVEVKDDTIKVFSQNQMCILSKSDARSALEYRILNKVEVLRE